MSSIRVNPETLSVLDRPNSYIGKSVPRPNTKKLVEGRGQFVDDMVLPRMVHVAYVRSPHAHARILSIDAAGAVAVPGVVRVLTGEDTLLNDRERALARWARAVVADPNGIGPADVDCAQLYDHYSGMVLLQLEDLGFCPRGEGGPFAASGALAWPAGALPTNTAGGSLSEAYIHGLNHVVEGVRALRGESTSPVDGAEVCLWLP